MSVLEYSRPILFNSRVLWKEPFFGFFSGQRWQKTSLVQAQTPRIAQRVPNRKNNAFYRRCLQ
jgi:hypothetical protein